MKSKVSKAKDCGCRPGHLCPEGRVLQKIADRAFEANAYLGYTAASHERFAQASKELMRHLPWVKTTGDTNEKQNK